MDRNKKREQKEIYGLVTVIVAVVFVFGGGGAAISFVVATTWEINIQIQVILWMLFAFFIANVLASIIGFLNLKSLEQHLGIAE